MRVIFADTGYWVALLNPHDNLHQKALNLSKAVQPAHIVTTEMVLVEVLNDLGLTQKMLRPSPLAPLPKRERGTRKIFYSPSPVLGEGVGG
jgi:predicted nucleic acid-binding protein